MEKNENHLFFELEPQDQQQLLQLNVDINAQFKNHTKTFWEMQSSTMLRSIQAIDFVRIANALPESATYHRIIISLPSDPICLVLFCFKTHERNGRVIMLHTYDHHFPNDIVYPMNAIINPTVLDPMAIVKQTPPHSHKAICHSCIPYIYGKVIITEQFYKLCSDNKVELIDEKQRHLNHCRLDTDIRREIHSISVLFY